MTGSHKSSGEYDGFMEQVDCLKFFDSKIESIQRD